MFLSNRFKKLSCEYIIKVTKFSSQHYIRARLTKIKIEMLVVGGGILKVVLMDAIHCESTLLV